MPEPRVSATRQQQLIDRWGYNRGLSQRGSLGIAANASALDSVGPTITIPGARCPLKTPQIP